MQPPQRVTFWIASDFHIGSILSIVFINGLFFWLSTANLPNFADDSTIPAFLKIQKKLLKTWKTDQNVQEKDFQIILIVNPGKFQSIIIERSKGSVNPQSLIINSNMTESLKNVKLLDIKIYNHLNFEWHVSTIYKQAAGQLNPFSHLKSFLNQDQENVITNSFMYGNFVFYPFIWH